MTVTRSKGFSLRDVLNDKLKQKISVIAKSGATIYDDSHYYKLKSAVKKARRPVVILWLGTCDITEKMGSMLMLIAIPTKKLNLHIQSRTLNKE